MKPTRMSDKVSVVIVGAGVAGLTTAVHLIKAGFTNVIVLEASDRYLCAQHIAIVSLLDG